MRLLIPAVVIIWSASTSINPANAQHLHQHGNHFDVHQNVQHGHDAAGHLTDGFGHHIDGDGRHTGSMGVFENGSYDRGWNSYPYYNTPTFNTPSFMPSSSLPGFASPFYPSVQNGYPSVQNGYATPNYSMPRVLPGATIVSAPPLGSTNLVNKIPVPNVNQIPGVGSQTAGAIAVRNPSNSGGAIAYTLNDYSYTIKPGEVQRFQADRNWVIKFDNGLGKLLTYRLEAGDYDFTVSRQAGWDVGRRVEAQNAVPQADLPPVLPQNAIPRTSF